MDVIFLPNRPMLNRMDVRYREWVSSRPQVFALFEKYALEALRASRRFGIALLCERVRWEALMTWELDETEYGMFKITNQHRTYLARDLVCKHPDLEPLIRMKTVKFDDISEAALQTKVYGDPFGLEQITNGGN